MSGNKKITLTTIGLVSVGTILGAYAYEKGFLPNIGSVFGSGIAPGQMPSCDSQTTISLATRAFHNSPRIKQLGVTIQRMNMLGQQYENKDNAGTVVGTHPAKTALRDLRQIAEHCRYGQPYAQCLWAA